MALMLGPEVMMNDLVQVFDSFLNDLDDVKSGILKHFSDFIRLLPAGQHREVYLGRLSGFIKPDNVRNWRFREDLAFQLNQLCDLYSSESVKRYVVPLTISLCSDRIAQVRQCSFFLVATIIAKFNRERAFEIANQFKGLLLDRFAKCSMFFGRLTFVQMCEVAMVQPSIDVAMFSRDYLPGLLALHADSVVNIRIALSRTLNSLYETRPEFTIYTPTESQLSIDNVVRILAQDSDRDVRSFCAQNSTLFPNSSLNTSEDFESTLNNTATASNSTFVVSSSQAEDSQNANSTQDLESSSDVDSCSNSSTDVLAQNSSGSNIGRHLRSVLDEINQSNDSVKVKDEEAATKNDLSDDVTVLSCEVIESSESNAEDEVFMDDSTAASPNKVDEKENNEIETPAEMNVTGDTNCTGIGQPEPSEVLANENEAQVTAELASLVLESEQAESGGDQSAEPKTPPDAQNSTC